MADVFLAPGFQRSNLQEVLDWVKQFNWRQENFGNTGCHGHVAWVDNAPNVMLAAEDKVWISFADRIEAFEHGGRFYIVAYS